MKQKTNTEAKKARFVQRWLLPALIVAALLIVALQQVLLLAPAGKQFAPVDPQPRLLVDRTEIYVENNNLIEKRITADGLTSTKVSTRARKPLSYYADYLGENAASITYLYDADPSSPTSRIISVRDDVTGTKKTNFEFDAQGRPTLSYMDSLYDDLYFAYSYSPPTTSGTSTEIKVYIDESEAVVRQRRDANDEPDSYLQAEHPSLHRFGESASSPAPPLTLPSNYGKTIIEEYWKSEQLGLAPSRITTTYDTGRAVETVYSYDPKGNIASITTSIDKDAQNNNGPEYTLTEQDTYHNAQTGLQKGMMLFASDRTTTISREFLINYWAGWADISAAIAGVSIVSVNGVPVQPIPLRIESALYAFFYE